MNLFAGLQWWQIVVGIVGGLFLLMILVLIHELGHAIAALRNGVEVEEFGLGMPPKALELGYVLHFAKDKKTGKKVRGKFVKKSADEKIFAKKYGKIESKTLITLNWLLPLGGFCKMKGESDSDRRKGSFGAATFFAKTKILLAGVSVNLVAAMAIFTVLAWIGLPVVDGSQWSMPGDNYGNAGTVVVESVAKNSPAAKSDLKAGDEIREMSVNQINGVGKIVGVKDTKKMTIATEVGDFTHAHEGEKVNVEISRNGKTFAKTVQLNSAKNAANGVLGVVMKQGQNPTIRATWSAPLVGIVNTLQFVWMTLAGLVGMIASLLTGVFGLIFGIHGAGAEIGAASSSVAGPVGIFGILAQGIFAGPTQLLFIMGIISLTLTVMNLLPVPAFDGGRWYLIAWYRIRRKDLTEEKEGRAVGIGVIIIIAIFVLATLSDILKLF